MATSRSERFGVGLVGLGDISRAHLAGYKRASARARVVAVCDQVQERAATVARELGARAYTRLSDLLENPEVIAVDLTLPHHVHFAAASEALAAGRHVLVEKPMALTSDECRRLIEQAREASLTLAVAENTRFVAAYQAVEWLLRSGALGEPRLARTLISGGEVARPGDTSSEWRHAAGSGGGAILDCGPHSFYLLRWLLGDLATVRGFHHRLIAGSEVDHHAVVAGTLRSGALYTTEYVFPVGVPWGERLELYCSEGSVIVDQLSNPPAIHFADCDDHEGRPLADVRYNPAGWKVESIAAGVADFVSAVGDTRTPTVTGEDGLHGVLVAERAYESAAAGGIELELW